MRSVTRTVWIVVAISACNAPADHARAEHERLVHERDSLRAALDSIRNGPDQLLAAARVALANDKPEEATRAARLLIERHPTSALVTQAKAIQQGATAALAARNAKEAHERDVLEKARADSARQARAHLARALSSTYTQRDNVNDVTFYYAKGISRYVNGPSQMLLYAAKPDEGSPSLSLRIRYLADDWLFIEGYTFKVDGRTFTIDASGFDDVKRDNGEGEIWEWYTTDADDQMDLLRAVIASKSAVIRYRGRAYAHDRTITADEKRGLQVMLDAYEALKAR
jgi:hypothetical protein